MLHLTKCYNTEFLLQLNFVVCCDKCNLARVLDLKKRQEISNNICHVSRYLNSYLGMGKRVFTEHCERALNKGFKNLLEGQTVKAARQQLCHIALSYIKHNISVLFSSLDVCLFIYGLPSCYLFGRQTLIFISKRCSSTNIA